MQLSALRSRVSDKLAEGRTGPVFYPAAEITAAINEANRNFCLLTLGLERTTVWNVPAAQTFTHMLTVFPDWICCLRITRASDGRKVRPAKLIELHGLDPGWVAAPGAPERYAVMGTDLVALYKQPAATGMALNVTYARSPGAMVSDSDQPEIPGEYQPLLADYAVYRLRQVEGGKEFEKAIPDLARFVDGVKHYAAYVRNRNHASGYEMVPFELEKFDLSALLGVPAAKGE